MKIEIVSVLSKHTTKEDALRNILLTLAHAPILKGTIRGTAMVMGETVHYTATIQ
jgi:hypothetical protein